MDLQRENGKESDFFFMENEDPEAVVPQIVKLVKENLPRYYHVEPSQIQVLTPMQRGVVGATNLNMSLQEALNPPDHEIFMRGRGSVTMPAVHNPMSIYWIMYRYPLREQMFIYG